MALTASAPRTFENPGYNTFGVKGAAKIYGGAIVGLSGTVARGLVAGDQFLGFAEELADNTDGADNAIDVRVRSNGRVVMAVTGAAAQSDVGKPVYASADDALTLTKGANSPVGHVVRWESGTTCVVEFNAKKETTIPDPADAPGTADLLRDDLVANVLPAIRTALDTLKMSAK